MFPCFFNDVIETFVNSDISVFFHKTVSQTYDIRLRNRIHRIIFTRIHMHLHNGSLVVISHFVKPFGHNIPMSFHGSCCVVSKSRAVYESEVKMKSVCIESFRDSDSAVCYSCTMSSDMFRRFIFLINFIYNFRRNSFVFNALVNFVKHYKKHIISVVFS